MLRSGLFWKVLLPGVGTVVAAAFVIAATSLSGSEKLGLMILLLLALVLHAVWITRRVAAVADSLATRMRELRAEPIGDRWTDEVPVEATSLARAAMALHQSHQERIEELRQRNSDFANTTALLEAVLDTMAEGVVVLDIDQQILFCNPASRPLLDIQHGRTVGRPLWEVARLAKVGRSVERVLASGQRESIEFEIPRTKLIVGATVTALPRDPLPGVMLVLHNVTELRRLESMRRDFVSNVSHELKTPLTSIQAYADTLLEDDLEDSALTREFLEKIVEQGERLGALILDIIRLGKIESQPESSTARPVAVTPVVLACLDAHAAVATTKGIDLRTENLSDDLHVLADAADLRTILDNLVDNALHYTPAGGTVTVRMVELASEQTLQIIEVADTGIGIQQDQISRVFERFYRVDRARDRQRGGTGLGLAIVKHLCQMFGGRVEVDSEMGVGTTFRVLLPVSKSAPAAVS